MKYSIIIPAHNSAAFIEKCLNSIEDQVFDRSKYELIIVCDACEDDTYKVALQYADKVLTTNFGNDGPPRQAGVDAASGDWILFLDDDDWWLHEYVLQAIDEALSYSENIDVLCFGFIFKGKGIAHPLRFTGGAQNLWPAVWNKCYRRAFIQDVKFRSLKPTPDGEAPDIDWTRRVIEKDPRINFLDMPLYYYVYNRPGSQTNTLVLREAEDDG